jgi:hypothetical protein
MFRDVDGLQEPDDFYEPSAEELDQWWYDEAEKLVKEWLGEKYPFAKGLRREQLLEAGIDALAGIGNPWDVDSDDMEYAYLFLTDEAEAALGHACALAWRDLCHNRRTLGAAVPVVRGERRPVRCRSRARGAGRPARRSASSSSSTSRGDPDGDGPGEPAGSGHHHLLDRRVVVHRGGRGVPR